MVQLREAHRARIGGEAAMYLAIRAVQLDDRRPEMAAVGEAVAEEHRLRKRRVLGQGGHGGQRQRGGQESAKRLAGRHADLRCLGCRAGGYAAGWCRSFHGWRPGRTAATMAPWKERSRSARTEKRRVGKEGV